MGYLGCRAYGARTISFLAHNFIRSRHQDYHRVYGLANSTPIEHNHGTELMVSKATMAMLEAPGHTGKAEQTIVI